jgi:hypothetical protein
MTYDKLAPEYATLWDGMIIGDRLKAAIDRMAAQVDANSVKACKLFSQAYGRLVPCVFGFRKRLKSANIN